MRHLRLFTGWVCLLSSVGMARADIWYVDRDAPVSGNGSAWCSAYTDLQDALAVADDGDEIRVANGTYTPDQGTGDLLMSFTIPSGVALLGGYAGCGAPNPDTRDPAVHETVLSGDLAGDDGPAFANYGENSFIVVRTSQASPDTLFDGFTISGGNADGPLNQFDRGGGMYNWLGGPTIQHCAFRRNSATYGGAINNDASDAVLIDCTFEENQGITGGGVIWGYNSQMTIRSCRFTRNDAVAGPGGAIYSTNCELAIENVDFNSNGALSGGALGGFSNTRGYVACATFTRNSDIAVYMSSSDALEFRDCTFDQNEGSNAGVALLSSSDQRFVRCSFSGNTGTGAGAIMTLSSSPAFDDCLFDGNVSLFSAGGALLSQSTSTPTFNRCVFRNNIAERGGALYVSFNATVAVNRSVFLQNVATQDDGGAIYAASDANLRMVGCRVLGNDAFRRGGGLYASRFSNVRAVSCEFGGNHAEDGGGVYNDFDSLSRYTGCTFSQNTADFNGDGIYNFAVDPVIDNCVLWNNGGLGSGNQIAGGSPQVDYSCIPGSWGGMGNISADPLFMDADGADDVPGTLDDDLRLASASPCIDMGSSGLLPADTTDADQDGDTAEPVPIDAGGHTRVLCAELDMGAHESGIGDLNCDGSVDITDFLQWNACMTGPGGGPYLAGCEVLDFELDHDVDAADYAAWQRVRSIP